MLVYIYIEILNKIYIYLYIYFCQLAQKFVGTLVSYIMQVEVKNKIEYILKILTSFILRNDLFNEKEN